MSAWGPGLYSSDVARDLRGDMETFLRLPGTPADILRVVAERWPSLADAADEDHTDLWLVLADQFHRHGIAHDETFARARAIVEDQSDLAMKRALGMSARDLAKRAEMLRALLETWSRPHPRPRKRRVLAAPEPHLFPVGSVLVYPTSGGVPRNPYAADPEKLMGWRQDGWGSALLLGQGHGWGVFAWECVARLDVQGKARPDLAACLEGAIAIVPGEPPYVDSAAAIAIRALPAQHVKRMQLASIGNVTLDAAKVTALHPELATPKPPPYASLAGLLNSAHPFGAKPRRATTAPTGVRDLLS